MSGASSKYRLYCAVKDGQEPAFVFLHGLGGTHRYWTAVPALGNMRRRVLLPDLLGFGDSPKPWCKYTIDRHLAALHELLKSEPPFYLIGHSFGAALALAYAARWPHSVCGLALLSLPYFGGEDAAYRWFRRMPGGWILTSIYASALACIVTRRLAIKILPRFIKGYPREILDDLVKHNMFSFTTSLWEVLYRHDLVREAAAVPGRIPVTCIHGDADSAAPLDGVRSLCDSKPSWRLHVLRGVDHHPWLRCSRQCADVIGGLAGGLDTLESRLGGLETASPSAPVSYG